MSSVASPVLPSVRDEDALRTIVALQKTALETQMDMARKYPRDPSVAIDTAKAIATQSQEVAEACMYAVPRGGKKIEGPSVRLAEIIASQWGHIMTQVRVLVIGDKEITAQGRCVDLQSGSAIELEVRRRITDKNGQRYNDDMITMTGNAACAIAFRNAVFKVIPAAMVQGVYKAVKAKALGSTDTKLETRRTKLVARLRDAFQISDERICASVEVEKVEDIGWDEIETLIGYGTAIDNGDVKAQDVFPAPGSNKSSQINEALSKVEAPTPPPEEEAVTETPRAEDPDTSAGGVSSPETPPLKLAPKEAASPPSPSEPAPTPAAKKPGPIDMVIMAMAEKGGIANDEAEQRLNSYSQKKFRKTLDKLSSDQIGSLRLDVKVIVDLNLIR